MLRSWLVLGVMLAQAGGFYPVPTASAGAAAGSHAWLGHALAALGLWVGKMKFDDACWSAYKAVCCAMLVGTFLGNLEGRMGGEVSFNLFPFAMLLYTHCSLVPSLLRPSAAAADPAAMQPRPSAHAVLTILMPFSLMLALHVMGVSRRWAGRKLLPGAVFGLLGQAHFLYVITHQIRAYPAFSFLGGILELLFLLAILLSLLLRALTQLLLDGSLSPSILGHPAGLPGWEDDWGVAVLKLAQAGLYDLSRRAGLANELVELNEQAREPEVHLSKTRAELLLPALPSSSVPGSGQARAPQFGFNREIRSIKVRADAERAGGVYGFSELARASWRLLRTVGAVARGVHRRWILKPHEPAGEGEGEGVEREGRGALSGAGVEGGVGGGSGEGVDAEGEEERVWRRFLQGVEEDEDEDEDWRADGTDEDEEGEEDDSEGADPARDGQSADEGADVREEYPLYSDLLQPLASLDQPDPAALSLAPVLVAHLTSPHALTRRRYQALMLHPPDTSASSDPNAADTAEWRAFLAQRRSERSQAQVDWARSSETALMCAVCMSEPRAVVCWPCRCLAMCDECRAGIAARFVLRGQHTCPCCRQTVDGYSRIYIP
ncbi:hypothetical protein CALCODRAFT_51024 [Calocera cornea HHB12733]|uniref:RING-type domain-containing protein n=1 Tax=Calocera cornea HHB12733 TaxID=1353952 RepID=A0A165DT70_9BASI|nr:hypothetical protein CALCODRAFT_51024 [Calocera cornea HHB12733]